MIIDPYLLVINVIGLMIGFVFIIVNVSASRLLTDPALKDYFRWITLAVILFIISFATDFLIFFIDSNIVQAIHHLLIILFLFIFVVASFNLLQEMKQNQKQ